MVDTSAPPEDGVYDAPDSEADEAGRAAAAPPDTFVSDAGAAPLNLPCAAAASGAPTAAEHFALKLCPGALRRAESAYDVLCVLRA